MGVLTRNGYRIEKSSAASTDQLCRRLLAKPYIPKIFNPWGVKPYKLYQETESSLYLPKHFGTTEFGAPTEVLCKAYSTDPSFWEFKGGLRGPQLEVVASYLNPAPRDGMICLQTGGGKTVCALYIASQLKVKTLIVVHNTFLRDQWIDRVHAFLPNARIGRIQGEEIDIADKDIVLAMIQSISMKDYPPDTFAGVGLTIIDECHHIASEVFVRAFPKITSQHMLGLTATPERKDKLMYVMSWFLGPILYRSESTDKEDSKVRVEVYTFETKDKEFNEVVYNAAGVMCTPLMVNKLAEFEPRTAFLVDLLTSVMEDASGERQVLVLTDRVEHCKSILAGLSPTWKEHACILSSGVKAETRNEWCAIKKILIATYSMCKEGFDVSTLNTLLIATPRPDVDQIVGRILRVEKSKRTVDPLILDVVDSTFRRQFQARSTLYKSRNYTIQMMDLNPAA